MGRSAQFDPDAAAAPGSGLFGLRNSPEDSALVVLPVPFEATTSYGGGASRGPAAILAASRQVDLFDHEAGRPYAAGIAMLPISRQVLSWNREALRAAGGVIEAGGDIAGRPDLEKALERVNAIGGLVNYWVRQETETLLDGGKIVVVLGGDHSVPYGAIEALSERHPGLGILHVDAHADLREAYEGFAWSHASIMQNVATRLPGIRKIVQVGVRDMGQGEMEAIRRSRGRIVLYHDADIASRLFGGETWGAIVKEIVARLPRTIYVSFDIDGLDPSLCPHTGTPVPGGLSFQQAASLLLAVSRSGRRIVGADLCEVSPGSEGRGEWDANVGARVLYKLIGAILMSGPRRGRA